MTKVKVSDYIADFLVGAGFSDVFLITGGGAMHLDDSLGKHPGLRSTYFHHEQACSLAADAYYRVSNRMPVVCVTSGPGGTNAITGVYGAYVDSMAMLVISGIYNLLSNPGHTLKYHVLLSLKLLLVAHVFAVAVLITQPGHPRRTRLMAGGAISSLIVIGIAAYLRRIY